MACASRASISSETTMVPISAAMTRAGEAGQHDGADKRAKFAKDGDGDDVGDLRDGAVAAENRAPSAGREWRRCRRGRG